MNKIMILGFLIVAENSDNKQNEAVPTRKTPTLDELFANAFQTNDEAPDDTWEKKYGQIFT